MVRVATTKFCCCGGGHPIHQPQQVVLLIVLTFGAINHAPFCLGL